MMPVNHAEGTFGSQAADGGGARSGAAAGEPHPHAAPAGGLPEDHQPARDP